MKKKQDLPNLDRSEPGLLHIDNQTIAFKEIISISDNEMTLDIDHRYFVPQDVLSTWNEWEKVKNNTFSLYPTEDGFEAIYFDDSDPIQENNFVNNLSDTSHCHWDTELKRYLKAYRFILNLLLRSGEIEIFNKPSKVEIAFDILNASIGQTSIWLEYYLLDNEEQLEKLNLTPPKKREYKPGKVAAKQYEYIKELSEKPTEKPIKSQKELLEKRYLCNWLLTYSSPAQIWFGLQVHHIKEAWVKKTTPGAIKDKDTSYEKEKKLLDLMKESTEKIHSKLIEDKDADDLSFDRAFVFTQIRFEELHQSNKYIEFVKARIAKNNYIRKKGQKGGTGIQTLRTDEKENLLLGNHKVELYDKATGKITYKK